MMKKITALLLAMLMLISLVPAMAETADAPSLAVVVAGSLGDDGFYDSSNEGRLQLKADGLISNTTILECKEEGFRWESDLRTAAESYDIVVAVGWQFWDPLKNVVPDYPDNKFIFIDNDLDDVGENLMSIIYKQNEGSFLVGYIAAKLSKTGKIGMVGGEDVPTINDFRTGYEQGAKYANPDIRIETLYTNDYEKSDLGKECATALYNGGCDIIFACAGKAGNGVFEAAKETGNLAIGVDSDQKGIDPDVIICSMVKNVGKSIYDVVANMDEMFQGGVIWTADMANGYIDVAYGTEDMPQQVSDELKAEVEDMKQLILNGTIVVESELY